MDTFTDISNLGHLMGAIGPLGLLLYIYWKDQRTIQSIQAAADKRFAAMKEMYEGNVILVKNYEVLTKSFERVTEALTDVITLNTQKMTEVAKLIEDNQFCPVMKVTKVTTERIEREGKR